MVGMCFKQNLSNIEKVFPCDGIRCTSVCTYLYIWWLYFESSAILRKWMITVQLKFSSIYLVIFVMKYMEHYRQRDMVRKYTYVTWLSKILIYKRKS